jgi:monoamine oxidase
MTETNVIIIGAGAAGLMAAYQLAKHGKKVIVLEARNRTGGRIHTILNESFFKHAELGAEFVHGDLPVTLQLLNEAKISYHEASGEMVRYTKGQFAENEQFIENWDLLLKKLKVLKEDINIYDFLLAEFPGDEHRNMRDGVWKYVSGYDTADPRKASAFALRNEWQNEDEHAQHRITHGYCDMIKHLADFVKTNEGSVLLNSIVKEIVWQKGKVTAITTGELSYTAQKLIIAMPLGVLQADENALGAIVFNPPIVPQIEAIKALGFGSVIKFLLQFDEVFWKNDKTKNMGYLLTDEEIPTWWTQHPQNSTLLTGWIGGPAAEEKKNNTPDELLQQGLQSLSNIFKINVANLSAKLVTWNIVNWTTEAFTLGSYSYDTVEAPAARKVLSEAVDNTLFFAGEYLYEGPAMGTVEAALTSGVEAAKKALW